MASRLSVLNQGRLASTFSSRRRRPMQRSSETIGAIAAALARAQIELTNTEKSQTTTIVSPYPREENRSFRYASLSSDQKNKHNCLGKHEIAAVLTTAI